MATRILNAQEVGRALGVPAGSVFRHTQLSDFPAASYVSGKRQFWDLADLSKIQEWCDNTGYFDRQHQT